MREFTPAKLNGRFKQWSNMCITSYHSISSNKGLKVFQDLTETYNLEKQDVFRFLQLRHYFDKNIKAVGEQGNDLIKIYTDASEGGSNRKLISRIYLSLQFERGHSTMYVKSKWETEAKMKLTEDDWLNIRNTCCTISSSDLWREFIWKNTLRLYSPVMIRGVNQRGTKQ